MIYHAYPKARRPEEYLGQKGTELGGLALPPHVLDSIAVRKTRGGPTEYVVIGEWRDGDCRHLNFAMTAAYIEATTQYRAQPDGELRWVCPVCGMKSGKHMKSCDYES